MGPVDAPSPEVALAAEPALLPGTEEVSKSAPLSKAALGALGSVESSGDSDVEFSSEEEGPVRPASKKVAIPEASSSRKSSPVRVALVDGKAVPSKPGSGS